MTRWFWKRWVWGVVLGFAAVVGLALAQAGGGKDAAPAAPPKPGDVMTLKFQNGPEQKVRIIKTERQPDGSYQSEVKDLQTGKVFTILDRTTVGPAAGKTSPTAKTSAKASDMAKDAEPGLLKAVEQMG